MSNIKFTIPGGKIAAGGVLLVHASAAIMVRQALRQAKITGIPKFIQSLSLDALGAAIMAPGAAMAKDLQDNHDYDIEVDLDKIIDFFKHGGTAVRNMSRAIQGGPAKPISNEAFMAKLYRYDTKLRKMAKPINDEKLSDEEVDVLHDKVREKWNKLLNWIVKNPTYTYKNDRAVRGLVFGLKDELEKRGYTSIQSCDDILALVCGYGCGEIADGVAIVSANGVRSDIMYRTSYNLPDLEDNIHEFLAVGAMLYSLTLYADDENFSSCKFHNDMDVHEFAAWIAEQLTLAYNGIANSFSHDIMDTLEPLVDKPITTWADYIENYTALIISIMDLDKHLHDRSFREFMCHMVVSLRNDFLEKDHGEFTFTTTPEEESEEMDEDESDPESMDIPSEKPHPVAINLEAWGKVEPANKGEDVTVRHGFDDVSDDDEDDAEDEKPTGFKFTGTPDYE